MVWSRGFTSTKQWWEWSSSGQRPVDIPSCPNMSYREEWKSWGYWLGTKPGHIAIKKVPTWRSFEDARDFARSLGFTSVEQWLAWSSSGQRPPGIPSNPNEVYHEEGWQG